MRQSLASLLREQVPGRNGFWALLAVAEMLAWLALVPVSGQLWFLPAGLRLALLWLVPARRWGWLLAGEVAAHLLRTLALGFPLLGPTFPAVAFAPWLVYAAVVFLLRGPAPLPGLDSPARMLLLLLAGVLGAAGTSPVLWSVLATAPMSAADSFASIFAFMYGDLTGQLMLAPLLLAILESPAALRPRTGVWRDIGLALAGALLVFLLLRLYPGPAAHLLLLAYAPLFVIGFRRGWEGAAAGIAALGLSAQALAAGGALQVEATLLQLVLAVVGGGALVLGTASAALRRSHEALAERHRELQAKTDELAALAGELREVTRRLVRMEEQGQRELAAELDYELGQAIHALGTRISLAFREVSDQQGTRLLESLREQVREIQDSLRRALRQLRPPLLDSHGLVHTLRNGPLRDMLDDAGIGFETAFEGPVDGLDDDGRAAVYRICQAVVREAIRLDVVRELRLRLVVRPLGDEAPRATLDLDLEYAPFLEETPSPQALPAIRDRVLAMHGRYRLRPLANGQRHTIDFPTRAEDGRGIVGRSPPRSPT
ncbi:MASE1 domain-containing protein [Arenimonas fontis]|uniref:MASE1 domain-containing protein n=1 Tax=Arenimonas fontis TaxID=2608255 RepID=A0A5B2Z8A9_9GAMM|nr:MASE1 domain-containing protein [Arenimonas fontis]KAA2284105.1 hypothetical protein F0415_10855 [Arenimonas fontis]